MTTPFSGLPKWEKLAFAGAVVVVLGVSFYFSYIKPKEPTLEDRVKAIEELLYTDDAIKRHEEGLYLLQERVQEVDIRTTFLPGEQERIEKEVRDLEEWVSDAEKKCDQCIKVCLDKDN